MTKLLALLRGKTLLSFICMFTTVVVVVNVINYIAIHLGLRLEGWAQFLWGYGLQSFVLILILYFWFYRRFPHDRKNIQWKIESIWQLIGYVVLIFASYFAVMISLYMMKQLFGLSTIPGLGEQVSIVAIVGSGVGLWAAFFAAVILAPTIEEYVFRGWGMICLPLQQKPYISIFINGIVFALFHFELSVIIPLTCLGIMISWVRYRSQSILPGIVFHIINNSLALFADYALHNNLT